MAPVPDHLNGKAVALCGTPVPVRPVVEGVVSLLEELLAEAKLGLVVAVAMATVDENGTPHVSRAYDGGMPTWFTMMAGVSILGVELADEVSREFAPAQVDGG